MAPKKDTKKDKAESAPKKETAPKKEAAPKKEKASGSGDASASIEESNKLRASLGLKPLDTGASEAKEGTSNAPVHAPADAEKPESAADVKRRGAAEKSRKEHAQLVKGEGLGDILAREEGKGGAADWINRTRNKDGSMKKVGAAGASSGSKKEAAPEAAEMPRLKVRHDSVQIQDGEAVTMTLSDRPILDADGNIDDGAPDELSNVRWADEERAQHNEQVRKQVEYDPSKAGQEILEKYDELKTGPAGFHIGGRAAGLAGEMDPEKKLALLTALGERESLESKQRFQADYYTSEEMAKIRKPPKKKTKKRTRTGDDKDPENQIGVAVVPAPERPADAGSDEEDPELYEQLSKQRRLVKRSDAGAMRKGEAALTAVSERIQTLAAEGGEDKEKAVISVKGKEGEPIAMTATTEFCNVVQTPLEKMDTMKHESFRGSTLYKQQVSQRKGVAAGESKKRKAFGAHNNEESNYTQQQLEEEAQTLIEEGLDLSCASGLAYLRARAQIGCDQDSHRFRKTDNRPLEMSTVDGDIKLEYRDDFGRVQTPKEAFRAISWKFHGKVPGRKNMERRILRLENEMKLKSMNPMEQLPTLRALRHVQHGDAKPYMVLSGANEK